ncbi:unnamed protein product [Durusdinium trenchii]|uniref:Uncharacterized protein n=1 Tax=Durusdinium trenchii TaxID=1381693 RepID=A0ABP0MPT8_9DINO
MAVSEGLEEHLPPRRDRRRSLKPHVALLGRRNSKPTPQGKEANLFAEDPLQFRRPEGTVEARCSQCGDGDACNRCELQGPLQPQEPQALVEPLARKRPEGGLPRRRTVDALRGASNLHKALQGYQMRLQVVAIELWKEALMEEEQIGPSNIELEASDVPMGSLLCSLSSVEVAEEEEEVEVHGCRSPQLSQSLENVHEWRRRKHLGRICIAWRRLAARRLARRLINKVCIQFHAQAILKKAFAAMRQTWRQSRARRLAVLQVMDQWLEERLWQEVLRSLRFWRSRAAAGALRRRGGIALKRFFDASCVRRWLSIWMSNAVWVKRISAGLASLDGRREARLRTNALVAWRRVLRRERVAQRVSDQKQCQMVQSVLKLWANAWRAQRFHQLRWASKAWRGFLQELRRQQAGKCIRAQGRAYQARAALLRWNVAISLRRREVHLRQSLRVWHLGLILQRWQSLKAATALEVRRLQRSTLCSWHATAGQLITERRQRELKTLGTTGQGSGPTQWQKRQQRRASGQCWKYWVQVVEQKKRQRRRLQEAKGEIHKLVITQALWLWHRRARDSAARADQIQRASTALVAVISASRWARAHDSLVHWFTHARARRIKCRATDLSGETLPNLSVSGPMPLETWDSPPCTFGARHSAKSRGGSHTSDLRMSDEVSADETVSVISIVTPPRMLCPKMKRWSKLAVLLRLSNSEALKALPLLQWSWSVWRTKRLRSQVHPLRWWWLMLATSKLRTHVLRQDFRRLRRGLKAWYHAVALSIKEAVQHAQEELTTCKALFRDLAADKVLREGVWEQSEAPCKTSKDLVPARSADVDLLLWAFSSWVVWARLATG